MFVLFLPFSSFLRMRESERAHKHTFKILIQIDKIILLFKLCSLLWFTFRCTIHSMLLLLLRLLLRNETNDIQTKLLKFFCYSLKFCEVFPQAYGICLILNSIDFISCTTQSTQKSELGGKIRTINLKLSWGNGNKWNRSIRLKCDTCSMSSFICAIEP